VWGFPRETQKIKFSVLSKDDLEAIHWASLDVLETTGIRIHSKKCLKILEEAGCTIDHENHIALIPSHLVEEALRKTSKTVKLYARNPKYDAYLDGRHVYITTDGNGTQTYDPNTGKRRSSTKDDIAKSAIIADALDEIHIYWPMVSAQDFPGHIRHLHDLEACFANTEKHVTFETTMRPKEALYQIDMATAILGSKKELRKTPIISSLHCTNAPLQLHGDCIEAALEFAKVGVPTMFFGMPQPGATGPVTLAGSIVVNNAEVLSCLVIAQLAHPGAPVIYGAGIAAFDLKACMRAGGGPEHGLTGAALAELARYYGMPSIVGGFVSTAKTPGAQASYDKLTSGFPQVFSGCDMIAGIGLLDDCTTLQLEEIVIDAEIVKIVFRLAQGIEVNDETLALDIIRKVGSGGNFLAERHTLDHLRKEHFIPELTDRRSYEAWLKTGAKDIVERAKEKVKTILKKHRPEPLEKGAAKEIREIIKRADKDLSP
jgi:trimethylamine--corrinoid protein Co-methyltransferase